MQKAFVLVFLGLFLYGAVNAQDKPAWTGRPSSVYPERLYLSAVGAGQDRATAENNAKAALAAYFRQSVASSTSIIEQDRQHNDRSVASSLTYRSTTETAAAIDNLMGVEIKDTWNDAKGGTGWWAIAVMEKIKGRENYASEYNKTVAEINRLIDIPDEIIIETVARCRAAREQIPKAEIYAVILRLLDGPDRQPELSILAAAIDRLIHEFKAMPVDIRVAGDKNGQIRGAFAAAFTAQGFRIGSSNARFVLEASFLREAGPRARFYTCDYTVEAAMKDTRDGFEVFPYNKTDRASHSGSQAQADDRALDDAAETIVKDFPAVLRKYFGE